MTKYKKRTDLVKAEKYIGISLRLANIIAKEDGLLPTIFLVGAGEHPDLKIEKRNFNSKKISFEVNGLGKIKSAFIG